MELTFEEYLPRKIVNVHKHVDGAWFWTKYSAHPYVGCRCGCEFCYLRDGYYTGRRDPQQLDTHIKVKTNAADRLRKELARLPVDVINCGDWQQPAEGRYQLSRQMLEVILEMDYPLLVIERSPLLIRDLDLLLEIQHKSWACVTLSFSNVDETLKRAFEPRSPGLKRRLDMMATLAQTGIPVGASLMPILPTLGDDRAHLEDAIKAFKEHGGSFVLAGGLTLAGVQATRSLEAARKVTATVETGWRKLYNWSDGGQPSYGPPRPYSTHLGKLVRELCQKHGLNDRIPRYIPPGPLAINKRITEKLFLKTYELELEQQSSYRIWAYRKAAWVVDELPQSLTNIYQTQGMAGLTALPDIGKTVAEEIALWIQE